jgi:hypothetical protein
LDEREWDQLMSRIESGACTPFLGAGACWPVLPQGAEIAQRGAQASD